MSHGGKLMPNLDQQSTKLLNLTVLQRMDSFVEEILITAAHVTFYEFDVDSSQWSRKDVEGSLFVVKRNTQPRFQFIVMNRRNADNLVESLLGDFEFEVQVPYLLYRNASQEVNGIWFYNAGECEEVANLFSRILNAYSKVPQKSKLTSTKSEFEELEAVPTMAVMDGPLEPSAAASSNAADVPDEPAFMNFFSSALNIGSAPSTTISGQPLQSSSNVMVPRLFAPTFPSPAATPLQTPSAPLSAPTLQAPPLLDNNDNGSSHSRFTSLAKPPFFISPPSSSPAVMLPVSSSTPTAPPLHPPVTLQRPYGTPILQPFPPPTPPPSLTPTVPTANFGPVINRDKVQEALLALVQDNQFIEIVHRAILNAHQS
ncbi:hypothetical protein SAY87_015652 [Trapa incisa]|uniref:mRNA-decapping enzyme-like protein n=1 Tax=Trapa incisa TaxID=236973 RepID=A0AAN7L5J1_9MYRT|nr:hypothetical protein SAY87_015652 [Trapa incisa]